MILVLSDENEYVAYGLFVSNLTLIRVLLSKNTSIVDMKLVNDSRSMDPGDLLFFKTISEVNDYVQKNNLRNAAN